MSSNTIRVVVVNPDLSSRPIEIDHTDYKRMQTLVGGYLEAVRITETLMFFCDEEGHIKDPSPDENLLASGLYQMTRVQTTHAILGPILLCGTEGKDGEVTSLRRSDEQSVERYRLALNELLTLKKKQETANARTR